MSQTMIYKRGLVTVFSPGTSYFSHNVDNPSQRLTESPGEGVTQKLSWNSSTYICESPKQMSFSSEGTTSVYKSLKRISCSESKSRKLSSGRITSRCSWNDEADACLLTYLKQNKDKIERLNNPHSSVKEELWHGASKWMLTNGYSYSQKQCYNRWKNNKQHYTNDIFLVERIFEQGRNTKRCFWSYEANICLLSYLEQNKDKIKQLNNPHSNVKKELWHGASKWMFTNGYSYSQKQCHIRWKNDKQHYMNGILNEEKIPVQYKSIIENILGQCNGRDK